MQEPSQTWESIFAREGLVFTHPHEDAAYLAALLYQRGAQTILDLGCGSGRHLLYFAQHHFTTYGIDVAPTGLALARQQLEQAGLAAELTHHDIFTGLPFADAFFDAVLSFQVIHHARLAHIRLLVDEIERTLKPGGLVFVTVPRLQNQGSRFQQIEPGTFIPLDGSEAGLPHHYFTPEELHDLFKRFTISDLHLDQGQHYCVTASKP
jgi:SAM-dependent methyltransferase